jgi:hypothetical protein
MSVVLPAKGDALAIKLQQPVIGDGDAMRISAEVAEHLHRAAESGFGVYYPVLPVQSPQELMKLPRIRQGGSGSRTAKAFAAIESLQTSAELAAEYTAKDLYRQKERVPWAYPAAVVR